MKLLHPIAAKEGSGPVRVIVVVRDRSPDTLFSSGGLARSYLDLVCDGPVRTVMICDSALPPLERNSIESALAIIASGGADLVVCTDLTRISRHYDVIGWFVNSCAAHRVRVLVFENRFDSAEENWPEQLSELFVDPFSSQGGGL